MNKLPISVAFIFASFSSLVGCGPGSSVLIGPDGATMNSAGPFHAEGTNVLEGMSWQLNRPIRLEFNHAVDPTSIGFGAINFRALDGGTVLGPVTGTFEIEEGSAGRVILFQPACPTNEDNSNGAFHPGGVAYELYLPTMAASATALRDTQGRSLEIGLRRSFTTPPLSQPQFLDRVSGPPIATAVRFPKGLNLFSSPDPIVEITFNQPIDARSTNLNTSNIMLFYSQGEIGSAEENIYPLENRVPGRLQLIENCTEAGAKVQFRITGILPVNRNLSLRLSTAFHDLVGQSNPAVIEVATHATPSLTALYADPAWTESDLAVDEFNDSFDTTDFINLDEPLPIPAAKVGQGYVAADFSYPGVFVPEEQDLVLTFGKHETIFTDSQTVFTDANSRQHVVLNGVVNVNDFTIEAGASLRGRGTNPLVIYASGKVVIEGTLSVSGNNATWPTGLNSPQFVEGGASGECGGGRGGDASQIGNAETLRAESGYGAFGIVGGGGGGGEGGFNTDSVGTGWMGLNATVAGGGGGGGFGRGLNESVLWTQWPLLDNWHPIGVDNAGPDHIVTRHTGMGLPDPLDYSDFGNAIYGSEPGVRGSAVITNLPGPEMIHGMEDAAPDGHAAGDIYDPAWTLVGGDSFYYGHPTRGPDRGEAGPSPFTQQSNDRRFLSDYYGKRRMDNGDINVGSLLTPWAGAGGGGGGDSMLIERWDADYDGVYDSLTSLYPVVPFQRSVAAGTQGWNRYRRGAGGGGGGGQLIIMALGDIQIGSAGLIQANGGLGYGGESLIYATQSVSGSGAGSGGHIVLHTSAKLDLSGINIGSATTRFEVDNLMAINNIQAFGGRRGWSGPELSNPRDGNQTFATGRGGAGANGVIQVHVVDPERDIKWHPAAALGIADFLTQDDYPTDHAEEMLNLVSAPTAYCLIPFFASKSMMLSEWIDTGAAELRLGDDTLYPDFGHDLLRFDGINSNAAGRVLKTGESVASLEAIAGGPISAVEFDLYTASIPAADTLFAAHYLRTPELLVGYDLLPDSAGALSFEIVDALFDRAANLMTLTTSVPDGPLTFALNSANPLWSVQKKFFRINTTGQKDGLPRTANIYFEFQVADAIPGTNDVGSIVGGADNWVADLTPAEIAGRRFLRYRVVFDANADPEQTMGLFSPLPSLDYVKIPMLW